MWLDPDLLKTFLAFAETGTLGRAAAAVHRSPSAVTAQMQRLEAIIGEPLLAPVGRRRSLTPAGEDLVGHARRILAVNREVWLSLKGAKSSGRIVLGITQDFADTTLPDLLHAFARTHPRVRLDLRVGRSHEMTAAFDQGSIDVLISMRQMPLPHELVVFQEPMLWLTASHATAANGSEVPLALLDPPCGFRAAAIAALDGVGRQYRIAATSPSLAGLRAAVRSGIAITPRTKRSLEPGVQIAPGSLGLPELPEAEFSIRVGRVTEAPASALATLLAEGL